MKSRSIYNLYYIEEEKDDIAMTNTSKATTSQNDLARARDDYFGNRSADLRFEDRSSDRRYDDYFEDHSLDHRLDDYFGDRSSDLDFDDYIDRRGFRLYYRLGLGGTYDRDGFSRAD